MCQLLLVNLNKKDLNRVFLSTLLQVDANGNQDGTGFLGLRSDGQAYLWKTELPADGISNLGAIIVDGVSSNLPIMAHVRAASRGINVNPENAHPFHIKLKRFYLAHNGRLYGNDESPSYTGFATDDTSIGSDSLKFLTSLEEESIKSPNSGIVELLNATMSSYTGKFALIIYDSYSNKHYVVRGSTADLHMVNIFSQIGEVRRQVGYIVNTKKNSLEDALTISVQIGQIVTGTMISHDDVTELDKDSVYEVEKLTLTKIGELKEKPVIYARAVTQAFSNTRPPNQSIPVWRLSERLLKFMDSHFLTIPDMDALLYLFTGVRMADISDDNLEFFVATIIPKISAPKKIRDKLNSILGDSGRVFPIVYTQVKQLEYPWIISSPKSQNELCDYMEALKKSRA